MLHQSSLHTVKLMQNQRLCVMNMILSVPRVPDPQIPVLPSGTDDMCWLYDVPTKYGDPQLGCPTRNTEAYRGWKIVAADLAHNLLALRSDR